MSLASRPSNGVHTASLRTSQGSMSVGEEAHQAGHERSSLQGRRRGGRVSAGGLGSVAVEGPKTGGSSQEALGVRVWKCRGKSRQGQSGVSLMHGERWRQRGKDPWTKREDQTQEWQHGLLRGPWVPREGLRGTCV